MSKFELDYKALIRRIIESGHDTPNRTGVDTVTKFGEDLTINLYEGFPIVTGKKIYFDKAFHEYNWIMQGGSTTEYLKRHGIHWWDDFTVDDHGNLGPTYGYQLRNFNGAEDQMPYLYEQILSSSRRACLTLWNPQQLKDVKIPPCYTFFNFVRIGNELNLAVTFRSSDVFLGLPYDICVLSLMLIKVAWFMNLKPHQLKLNLDNAHVYTNHTQGIIDYLDADIFKLPKFNNKENKLINYQSGDFIAAKLNV
jgi:thymidylate synthase